MSVRCGTRRAALLSAAVLVSGCTGTSPATPDADGTASVTTPHITPSPRTEVPTSTEVLRADPGDDLQAIANAAPVGATIRIGTGVHREQQVIPKDGQRFVGEPDAVLSGARILDLESFRQDADGRWYVDGQEQEGLRRGQVDEGRPEAIRNPEEVFVDGERRLEPVDRLGALGPATFYFDYEADRIYLGDDPRTYTSIETSTTPFAFGGTGVRGVTVENVIVEKYASPVQFGAIGGSPPEQFPHDWTIRNVDARYNHGGGLGIGPGMTIEGADVHHNGQIGVIGHGEDQSTDPPGYRALVTIRNTRIHHNNVLGFRWRHEAGATKFKSCTGGFLFERNWIHDNLGAGAWWDHDNYDATIRDNLVEGNEGTGIFYEISFGSTTIENNVVRDNGTDDSGLAPGIFVSNSEDVTVRSNTVVGSAEGIYAISRPDRHPLLSRLVIEGNSVALPPKGVTGVEFEAPRLVADVTIRENRYHVAGDGTAFAWGGQTVDFARWNELGMDPGGQRLTSPPATDALARPFEEADYGPTDGG